MASQSLYRKWRSQTFGDLIGQEPIIRTLKNALSNGNLAHAYLFTGPRGTGKTSTARLLAKTVNCAHPVDGEPCNKCQQCREITAGNSFNVIEIDAASNRGIDSIRDLREKVMMPPSTGKYKVYVLDEAHMLTTEAFNALLKTLEEPPGYAIFVLATTDVHKMLPTVLSRCQRFDFKRLTTRLIVEHLNFVAGQEHIKIERTAAELIARAAAGGMRDALSLLDQAIAYSGNEISLAQVQAMLGVADPRAVQKLVNHVAQLDSAAVLHLIHELSEAGADLRQLNIQVGEYWRSMMLAKAGADIAIILDLTEDETSEILQMTRLFELEELTEFARIFAQNDLMQKSQGTPQLGLELAFLQSIEQHRHIQSGQSFVSPSVPSLQQRSAPVQVQTSSVVLQEARQSSPARARQPSPPGISEGKNGSLPDLNDSPSIDGSGEGPGQLIARPEISASNATLTENSLPSLTLQQVKDAWENVKKRVRPKNPKTAAMLNSFTVVGVEGTAEEAVVVIQAAYELHHKYVQEGERSKDVDWAISTEFRQKCRVRLLAPGQPVPVSPAYGSDSHPASTAMQVAPQQSVQLDRPASTPPVPARSRHMEREGTSDLVQAQEPTASVVHTPAEDSSSPVVKNSVVRENTTIESSTSSPEALRQKVSSDPVVQEVMKTFTAKIVDIRTK
ncbi:MAG: DNA polymerase III subunit gamma/tau [Ktedonobacteraceae bacterium]